MFIISCTSNEDISNRIDELNPSIIEKNIDEPIDLSIKNILIYPNKFDKNSFYIDTEIFSDRFGQGEVQIALLNDGKLVAYNSIIITSDESNYFQ